MRALFYMLCAVGVSCGGATESGLDASAAGSSGQASPAAAKKSAKTLSSPRLLRSIGGAVDLQARGGYVYWNDYAAGFASKLVRVAEPGGELEIIFNRSLTPFTVVEDWLYYFEGGTGMGRMPSSGGSPEPLAATTSHCYVVAHTPANLFCAHGQGVIKLERSSGEVSTLGKSQGYIAEGIAVDQSWVYWVAAGELLRVSQQGGETQTLVPTLDVRGNLVGDAVWLYFSSGHSVLRVAKSGGEPEVLRRAAARSLQLGDEHLFWLNNRSEPPFEIVATPLRGDAPDIIVASSPTPFEGLAVGQRGVFWTTQAGPSFSDGKLYVAEWQ